MGKRFLLALQFLTIVPVRIKGEVTHEDMARSAGWFPVAGLLQGVALVAADLAFGRVFHPDITTALVILVLVISNGAFHLDGLADTADALAAKGDVSRKLKAMKDSATGPAGVTAIVFALGLKYLSLKSVSNLSSYAYYSSLLMMPMAAKWAMLPCMLHGRSARDEGLGKIFIDGIKWADLARATLFAIAAMCGPAIILRNQIGLHWAAFGLAELVLLYLLALALSAFFRRRFNGLTGDTLGAVGEVAEISYLWMVIIWSRLYI